MTAEKPDEKKAKPEPEVEIEVAKSRQLIYRVDENPPIYVSLLCALQQAMLSLSKSLTVVLLVSELVCSEDDEVLKTKLFSSTMVMSGLCTLFQAVIGIRLPLYQGPSASYVVPLLALASLDAWKCPPKSIIFEMMGMALPSVNNMTLGVNNMTLGNLTSENMTALSNMTSDNVASANIKAHNMTSEEIDMKYRELVIMPKIQLLSGSLLLAGAIHTVIGMTGMVGAVLRFVGPITVVPAITLIGLFMVNSVNKFISSHWGVGVLTAVIAIVLSLYCAKMNTLLPWWSKKKGFHIKRYPLHRVFSILIAMIVGWVVSYIMTVAGQFTDDPSAHEYKARADYRIHVVHEIEWFSFPYPGPFLSVTYPCGQRWKIEIDSERKTEEVGTTKLWQGLYSSACPSLVPLSGALTAPVGILLSITKPCQFGMPRLAVGVFISFLIATFLSVIDSIGDYYACAKVCQEPPPPSHAVNRGIMVEGIASTLSGAMGIGHSTSTIAGNIGAIAVSKVASRRVFQIVGVIYIIFGIIGKIGAFFISIPYCVLGGVQVVNFGILIGVVLSNLSHIDLKSTRNLSIIGISLLVGMMIPNWMKANSEVIDTGEEQLDNAIKSILTNAAIIGGGLACLMDNTIPGTLKERGLISWQVDILDDDDDDSSVSSTAKPGDVESRSSDNSEPRKDLLGGVYDLPFFPARWKDTTCFKKVPFMPGYRQTRGISCCKKRNKTYRVE